MANMKKAEKTKFARRYPIELTPEHLTTMNDDGGGDVLRDDDTSNQPKFDDDNDVNDEHVKLLEQLVEP